MSALPLAGKTIVVTRTRQQASHLSHELESLGAGVVELPTIEIAPPESYKPLDAALQNLQQYQWLIVTSSNTVRVLVERMQSGGVQPSAFSGMKIAAIGSATSTALREAGFSVDLAPAEYVAESMAEVLGSQAAGARMLLVRAAVARDVIPDAMRQAGAVVDVVDAYRTVVPEQSKESVREVFGLQAALPDAVTFTSSSTVVHFFRLLQDAGLSVPLDILRAISIGPVTSAALREYGWEPAAEADPHDIQGLVRAVVRVFRV